jgi:hypothetical protein
MLRCQVSVSVPFFLVHLSTPEFPKIKFPNDEMSSFRLSNDILSNFKLLNDIVLNDIVLNNIVSNDIVLNYKLSNNIKWFDILYVELLQTRLTVELLSCPTSNLKGRIC